MKTIIAIIILLILLAGCTINWKTHHRYYYPNEMEEIEK